MSEQQSLFAGDKISRLEAHLGYSMAALNIYDIFLTFQDELSLIWYRCLRLPRLSCLLYLVIRLNQYLFVCTIIVPLLCTGPSIGLFPLLIMNEWVLPMTSMLYAAIVAAMRVYAISNRNRFLALLAFSLGLAPFALHIAASTTGFGLYILSRALTIACDIVVIIITWRTTSRIVKFRLHNHGTGYTLSWYLLRDGTAYFVIILALNTVDIIVLANIRVDILTTTITIPLSTLLLARLLLNLRKAVDKPGSSNESSGFLDTVHPVNKDATLVFLNGTVSEDTEMSDISGSTRREIVDVTTESFELFASYEEDTGHDHV